MLSPTLRLKLIIGTGNIQCIKGKESLLLDHIKGNKMDAFVVTETWLTSKDRDKVWMEASELKRNNNRLMTVNRTKGRGGGLAIVYNSDFDMKLFSSSERNTFQFAIWS